MHTIILNSTAIYKMHLYLPLQPTYCSLSGTENASIDCFSYLSDYSVGISLPLKLKCIDSTYVDFCPYFGQDILRMLSFGQNEICLRQCKVNEGSELQVLSQRCDAKGKEENATP